MKIHQNPYEVADRFIPVMDEQAAHEFRRKKNKSRIVTRRIALSLRIVDMFDLLQK